MDSKIKVRLNTEIKEALDKDCFYFGFMKENGKLEKNDFLLTVILNYYTKFVENEKAKQNLIASHISSKDELTKTKTASEIVKELNSRFIIPFEDRHDDIIAFRPNKENKDRFDYIIANIGEGDNLSSFFRSLLASYVRLPLYEREQIMFAEQISTLRNAIKSKKKVFISFKDTNEKCIASPHSIQIASDDLGVYLLAKNEQKLFSCRLTRISSVIIKDDPVSFTQEDLNILQKSARTAPQFIYNGDEKKIEVKLTPEGAKKFNSISLYRPQPLEIVDGIYLFNCSYEQAIKYFISFGNDAYILRPYELRVQIYKYYKSSFKYYQDNYMEEMKKAGYIE